MRAKPLTLILLASLASCAAPGAPRPKSGVSDALPPGPTRYLISNQGQKVPCTVYGGGMCIQR